MKWEIVIGLETHAQLSTVSKIFSGASTAFGAAPNTQASAVDIALPGVLPVLNKGAVERAIRFGLAVGGADGLQRRSVFARKNYFYPDLPKGYQISQYELPIVGNGALTIMVGDTEKTIRITRAHLEEDAGKSIHGEAISGAVGFGAAGYMTVGNPLVNDSRDLRKLSAVDLNRAGTPLLEIVSEPDMRSAAEAVAYAKTLHSLVRWIGICDGNMQEGSFRCDANVSVRPQGSDQLGTRCEIKNLNSFRFLERAIEFEVRRQIELLEEGGNVVQETRLYDPDKDETRPMRSKEDAMDYRYFPDPDLPPLVISEELIGKAAETLVAIGTPKTRQNEYIHGYELSKDYAKLLVDSREISDYFDKVVDYVGKDKAKVAANWVLNEVLAQLNRDGFGAGIEEATISAEELAMLIKRECDGTLSHGSAKLVFQDIWLAGKVRGSKRPDIVDDAIKKLGLKQISDNDAIEKIVDQVIAANPRSVEEFKAGKDKAFNALVGQVMKATQGKANPAQVNELLRKKLGG